MIGKRLGQYQIRGKLGAGGMGEVYLAHDSKLGREIAIKVLPGKLVRDEPEALERLRREATLLAALNHPNVATIHALEEGPDGPFLVLEHVVGETLSERLQARALEPDEAAEICAQVARGMAAAHDRGIVHRDLKPANVMITGEGRVKVLDFGIGKSVQDTSMVDSEQQTGLALDLTSQGTLLGTVPYMSPEGIRGQALDEHADVWAFGCLLYESLAGESPFERDTVADTLAAIIDDEPRPLDAHIPEALADVVDECLQKDPERRASSLQGIADRLAAVAAPASAEVDARRTRSWRLVAGATAALAVVAMLTAWFAFRQINVTWATDEALPQIYELIEQQRFTEAVELAQEAERYVGGTPELEALWPLMARDVRLTSNPDGAVVSISPVRRPRFAGDSLMEAGEWTTLGEAPRDVVRLPLGSYRVRVERERYRTREALRRNEAAPTDETSAPADTDALEWRFAMRSADSVPDAMVMLGPGKLRANLRGLTDYDPDPDRNRNNVYLLGKHEVTNAEYKSFVDAGGYSNTRYWKQPFVRDGRELSWEDAIAEFHDSTGRLGPATWSGGTFPPGEESLPVTGLSWFEAAAYADFAGGALPTVYHWLGAKRDDGIDMSAFGNFRGEGPMPVGSTQFGRFGVYDLAGNVREWTFNAAATTPASETVRFILGGGWTDPGYAYHNGDVAPPWDRSPRNGLRIANLDTVSEEELAPLRAPIELPVGDEPWGASPAPDDVFEALAARYAYDRLPLNAVVGSVDDSSPYWTKETVTFDTASGERMVAYLFLPKNTSAPFQTLLHFPGAGTIAQISSDTLVGMDMFEYVLKSGRAVMHPVYTSTYERFDGIANNGRSRTRAYVARKASWVLDARRALDYLETRSDVDPERLAYWGFSWGAEIAPITLAVDARPRAAVLMDGGALLVPVLPDADEANFVPRVTVPVLMINGSYDYVFPVETAQRPFFELLGTPADRKRHEIFDSGHVVAATLFDEAMSLMVEWLDGVFGPVQ